jgi:ABC-2 type transport system permease protein
VLVLGGIGFTLGWRPSFGGLVLTLIFIAIGTVTFSTMGLLLGGTLKAEIVLALANILWFVMLAIGSVVFATESLPTALEIGARLIPSGALAESLTQASVNYAIDALGLVVLLIWASICGTLAARTFRFE